MKALITGIDGFCGKHLAEWLTSQGVEVLGIDLPREAKRADHVESRSVTETRRGDIQDSEFVFDCVRGFQPERIYHLAGVTA
ncbi:MAG: GDP-mannose 4,6-dehydratase, partial [Spirochaetes bacterium]|nr:GDP-mannose 4,6-dehydratase [Spirochaetota bacterium]